MKHSKPKKPSNKTFEKNIYAILKNPREIKRATKKLFVTKLQGSRTKAPIAHCMRIV